MDEMLPDRPETWLLIVLTELCIPEIDVVIVPMLVDSVAVFPWIVVTFASRLERLVVIVPNVVWIVASVPLIEVTFAPIAFRVVVIVPMLVFSVTTVPWMLAIVAFSEVNNALLAATVLFIAVTVELIAVSKPVLVSVSGSANTVKLATAVGALLPLPVPDA